MKTATKRKIGTGLLLTGLLLVGIALSYIVSQYPLSYLQYKVFGSESVVPPDPAPLPVQYTFPGEAPPSAPMETLPGVNNQLFHKRETMNLTLLGRIKIPLLGVSENIVEGVDKEMLYAVGHIPGTAYPGAAGNSVLAAHRDYIVMHPFMHLSKLSEGDTVLLDDVDNNYTYQIFKTFTVTPEDVWITELQEGETHMLTLITCSPTYTRREVCWARLVETTPKSTPG